MNQGTAASETILGANTLPDKAAFVVWPYAWGCRGSWPQLWWGAVYQQAWQNAQRASAMPKRLQVRATDWPRVSRN